MKSFKEFNESKLDKIYSKAPAAKNSIEKSCKKYYSTIRNKIK